jgi:hypothetical protein
VVRCHVRCVAGWWDACLPVVVALAAVDVVGVAVCPSSFSRVPDGFVLGTCEVSAVSYAAVQGCCSLSGLHSVGGLILGGYDVV